jgi:hypothetical protein
LKRSRVAEIVLGLVVAAAIVAVSFAIRQRQAPGDGSPAADVPDVSRADATLDLGDVRITVSAGPRPLLAFSRNRFRFRAEKGGAPVALADGVVSFTMTMPMGDHRHALVPAGDGWQEAEAVLPLCPSGNRRWLGDLGFTLDGRAHSARFAFDLNPPSSRGSAATEDPRDGPRGTDAKAAPGHP